MHLSKCYVEDHKYMEKQKREKLFKSFWKYTVIFMIVAMVLTLILPFVQY